MFYSYFRFDIKWGWAFHIRFRQVQYEMEFAEIYFPSQNIQNI